MQKRGRKPFKPTPALRRKVANGAGSGMSHEEIALGIGIARTTLLKHFRRELSIGAYEKRLEMVDAMHRAGKRGNVAAMKAYLALTPQASAPPVKPAKLGKKDQAQVDADEAPTGTEWGELLPGNVTPIRRG
jgi:hypothetical protein